MPSLVPLTELDAVNEMLISIGQAPVSTLSTGIRDVAIAQTQLHNVSRAVQSRGWPFNSDTKYEFAFDGNGKIAVPSNAFKLDSVFADQDFVIRNDSTDDTLRLWDRYNHTFDISANHLGPIMCDVVWFYAFEQIPQYARNYIALRAARKFQATVIGSDILYRFTKQDEMEAFAEFLEATGETEDANLLYTNDFTDQIFHRRLNP